ncbi:ABC transporter ATP-binding protein [bacterium]|nr:ABC transporter ATP-binding protein [bacterium]
MKNNIITFNNVSFNYNKRTILQDISFSVAERESICLIGPNGSGKSTILKLILALLTPNSGEITVFGTSPEQAKLHIGYMPQHINYDPFFPINVKEIVLMGRLNNKNKGFYCRFDKFAAQEVIDELGLTDLSNRQFCELSGGEQQRVLIARALVSNPQLLLLDEPMANVDTLIEKKLSDILKTLQKRMAVIMVSHDLGLVANIFQKVICVNKKAYVHKTDQLDGTMINQLYGEKIRLVNHDKHSQR